MNILAISAHPADAFDLAAGMLANFASAGHDVRLAVVTHGAYSHAQLITKDGKQEVSAITALKKGECDAAARHVGLSEVRYLDFDDEPFIVTRETVLKLGEYIREVKPEIVITHHPGEYGHPDHPVAGDMSMRSIKAAERWLQGSTRSPHSVRRIYFYGTQFRSISTQMGRVVLPPDFVVDITPSIEKKKRAVAAFQSQSFKGAQYEEKWVAERIEKIEGNWGFLNGLKYAEEFIAWSPQTVQLLP